MGTFLRGAFVQLMPTMVIPIPNVIAFQFNPEEMTHTWTQPQAPDTSGTGTPSGNPLAVRGAPGETLDFTIKMDSGESVAAGGASGALAEVFSLGTRLAALEMLVRPSGHEPTDGLLGAGVAALMGKKAEKPPREVPDNKLPMVLFLWGPARILPVRVTKLTVTEKLYDPALQPTHAEAQIGLQVLNAEDLNAVGTGPIPFIANATVSYMNTLREALAIANLANAFDSVVGMIPH